MLWLEMWPSMRGYASMGMVKRQPPLVSHGHRKRLPSALRARFDGAKGRREAVPGGRDLLAAALLLLLPLPSAGGALVPLTLGALLIPLLCGALLLLVLSPAAHAAAVAALATAAAMANCRLCLAMRQASAGDEGANREAVGEAADAGAFERSESASASASSASSPSFNSSPHSLWLLSLSLWLLLSA